METQLCINYQTCPIFSGALQGKDVTSKNYRHQYFEAGEVGWSRCKRFIVKTMTGKCPPDLLPNSYKSIDDIVASLQ